MQNFYDFWLQILVSEHIVEICSTEVLFQDKYMSGRCWRYGEQNPRGILCHDDLEVEILLKGHLMSIYSHCFVRKVVILINNNIFLSCWKLKRVREKEECTSSAGLFFKSSHVQRERAFFLFSRHDPMATLWLGEFTRGHISLFQFLSPWMTAHMRARVCLRACQRVWMCEPSASNAGILGN